MAHPEIEQLVEEMARIIREDRYHPEAASHRILALLGIDIYAPP